MLKKLKIVTILNVLLVFIFIANCSATPYNFEDREHREWIFIEESYGDIYHYRYEGRDNHEHCYLIWVRKEIPGKDVVPANGFRKIRYTLYGIDVRQRVYAKYEEIWYTKNGEEYSHDYWDSNWRPIRTSELDKIVDDLRDRDYR